ncbi:MAG: cbb3-type cytochrome c oxidase subunit I [Firmicutes bacterium]|nr:cbb3-type cytochrome c oxidase subunit I [Bacillota bacterium]
MILGVFPFRRSANQKGRRVSFRSQPKPPEVAYPSQQVAVPFLVTAALLLGLQVFIATAGALDLVFPDLPAPVPFNVGRSIHLNLSLLWPVVGLMGGVFYILPLEVRAELVSPRLARLQFWLVLATTLGILGSLALGYTEGREYLEATRPFDVALLLILGLFAYNVLRTIGWRPRPWRPTLFGLWSGIVLALLAYLANAFFFPNPAVDEYLKFWVVHLWEEGLFELLAIALIGNLLLAFTGLGEQKLEKWYAVEIILVLCTGFFATGHHYFWIGVPSYWLYLGGVFGALQPVPILLLSLEVLSSARKAALTAFSDPAMGFLLSSVLWNLVGAGGLGFLITTPPINRYTHGTYITSAHAHAALFGTYGFLVLAAIHFILPRLTRLKMHHGLWSLSLLNLGLLVMTVALFLAGFLQTYLWRVGGWGFGTVRLLLRPYLALRVLGGFIFACGGVLPAWDILSGWYVQRR